MFTARFEHDFNDNVSIRNSTRYGRLEQFYVLTGVNAVTIPSPNPDTWTVNRTRQSKFQENTLMTNQTNLTINVATGGVSHAITTGVEFISEEQYNPTYAAASLGTLVPANPYDPGLTDAPPGYAPARNGVFTRGETQTIGAYVFDTLSFAEKWEVTGGFRVDHVRHGFRERGAHRHGTATRCSRRRSSARTTRCSRTRSACCSSRCRTAASIYRMPIRSSRRAAPTSR